MSINERDKNVMAVAYLTVQGMLQEQIKDALNLNSQAEVSRLWALAKREHWIQWQLNLPSGIDESEIALRAFREHDVLKRRLDTLARDNGGEPVAEIRVLHTNENDAPEQRLRQFGRQAADYVVQLLQKNETKTCAVAWGRTIASLIEAIPQQSKQREDLEFIPVAGEPLEFRVFGFSPTRAAQLLAQSFIGDEDRGYYSLNGVAARIPQSMADDASIIRRFCSRFKDYGVIFEGDAPLMDSVDMIITGIGNPLSSSDDPWFQETNLLEGIDDLEDFAAGNIGGVLLPKNRHDENHGKRVEEINGRWLGIQKEHFQKAAKRAAPGVVILAFESEKAPVVAQAIGMVNHLIIDQQLANALIDLDMS